MKIKKLASLALKAIALATGLGLMASPRAEAAFGLTTSTDFYTVDTGAGLVFKVRRTDNGSSTQSPGDIASLVWNGVEFQDQSRGSQINSGFDYLYSGVSAVTVSASVINSTYIKITVQAGNLTHYYMARSGYPHIYMATYFTTEPDTLGLCRYILRLQQGKLPNGPTPSDIRNNTGAIESGDIFGMSDGTTRSKHYSNQRLLDWSYIGATGSSVGVWVVRDNNEGNSGGPFYRSLLNQCTSTDQEITYIVNYGEAQTEAYRTNILNSYTLVCTTGATPSTSIDTSWFSSMGLTGYVAASGRGRVTAVGIAGRDTSYAYTVGFANSRAQYWAAARASDGYFNCTGMLPGTYTMTIYKNELAVYTGSVTVTAGGTTILNTITITADPSSTATLWRIGNWDGTPNEFLNGTKMTYMHPSDARMSNWGPKTFAAGNSPSGFPAVQFRGTNSPTTVTFNLTSTQAASAHTVKIGLTTAYNNGRPQVTINGHTLSNPSASSQPKTRTITIGSYRGNNTTYSWSIPASYFNTGANTMTVTPISGNSDLGAWLSASWSYDCMELDN
jgi:rhamnogalacturonan endolyase